ncbi:protoporphyrinogen oxidase [Caryophanon tenue]|uniref:Coproporphyrinogen III oxidase n=1 Tax=Caryophanon tenue TaxID=33978 RepID=A0A1C0Y5L9_9BACL|nr:protoporphyrinogen oxidase [Caryophanon tenue]OCS82472.1 protoporphyrinogen oxidase [Caryophanon tenue]
MKTIAVIGGGITGLSAMYELQKNARAHQEEVELLLIERNPYVGGKIHTTYTDTYKMETGADSIVARHPGVQSFIEELGLTDELVYNEVGASYIHTNEELHLIPLNSTFGIPMSVESLMSSTLISEEGKQRALQDLTTPNTTFTKDSSIGEFLAYFLGEELVNKQIAPVLSGVYSGNLYELSIASTIPYLIDYKNKYGSIIKGFEANRETFEKANAKKFISFKRGLSSMMERIEERLDGVEVLKGVSVELLEKKDARYALYLSNCDIRYVDEVIVTTPHDVTKQLFANDVNMQSYFERFRNGSAITVYLGYDVPDSILPADGTGFIVSHNSSLQCNACTWTSRKWKHTSTNDKLLVRLFYKDVHPRYEEFKAMSDEELIEVAKHDIATSLQLVEEPVLTDVTKWIDQMPRYDLSHRTARDELVNALQQHYPGVTVAGCSFYGVGVGACIQNGREIARDRIPTIS